MTMNIPAQMQRVVDQLRKTTTQEECVQQAYDVLTTKYHGNRIKTLIRLPELFTTSLDALWARNGFLHCTNLNRLLRALLQQSGHFAATDIKECWTLLWYVSPHQFLRVRMTGGKWVNVDVWSKSYGIPLGDYAHGFHTYA